MLSQGEFVLRWLSSLGAPRVSTPGRAEGLSESLLTWGVRSVPPCGRDGPACMALPGEPGLAPGKGQEMLPLHAAGGLPAGWHGCVWVTARCFIPRRGTGGEREVWWLGQ